VEFEAESLSFSILDLLEKTVQSTIHSVSKVLYFADKEHLEKYGRFICGDSCYAMKHGPVPSQIYDNQQCKTEDDIGSIIAFALRLSSIRTFSLNIVFFVHFLLDPLRQVDNFDFGCSFCGSLTRFYRIFSFSQSDTHAAIGTTIWFAK
jgi:hypothetical protein